MSTIPDVKTDREAVLQALAEGRPVDPDVRHRIEERAKEMRAKVGTRFDNEFSVELVRSIRDE